VTGFSVVGGGDGGGVGSGEGGGVTADEGLGVGLGTYKARVRVETQDVSIRCQQM